MRATGLKSAGQACGMRSSWDSTGRMGPHVVSGDRITPISHKKSIWKGNVALLRGLTNHGY